MEEGESVAMVDACSYHRLLFFPHFLCLDGSMALPSVYSLTFSLRRKQQNEL